MFKEPITGIFETIIDLHQEILVLMTFILIAVLWFIVAIMKTYTVHSKYKFNRRMVDLDHYFLHEMRVETVWTIIPGVILLFIAVPSFGLLYMMEEGVTPKLTVKVTGYQWYWHYEYQMLNKTQISFDSYMLSTEDLEEGSLRLLSVDNGLVLPERVAIRILVTSMDVLHAWAVPEFGIKVDAVPGRLNQVFLYANRVGVFYGQCSELCGVNHGFMPIEVDVVDLKTFILWADVFGEFSNGIPSEDLSDYEVYDGYDDGYYDGCNDGGYDNGGNDGGGIILDGREVSMYYAFIVDFNNVEINPAGTGYDREMLESVFRRTLCVIRGDKDAEQLSEAMQVAILEKLLEIRELDLDNMSDEELQAAFASCKLDYNKDANYSTFEEKYESKKEEYEKIESKYDNGKERGEYYKLVDAIKDLIDKDENDSE